MTLIVKSNRPEATFKFAASLAFLAMLGPFSVDAYLPAFPNLAAELNVSPIHVQQTLTAYFVPFAVMNLFHGTISDSLGRRRTLIAALAMYTLASLGCMLSKSIDVLLMFRAMQGMSAGAGVVAVYAITRDCFEGSAAQKVVAYGALAYTIAPVLAPVLGGLLLAAFGWRSIFGLLATLGLAMLALVLRSLPETLPPHLRQAMTPRVIFANYWLVLAHREGQLLTGALAFSFAGGFVYIASASAFLTRHFGVSSTGFAWLFVPLVGGSMTGAFVSSRLASCLTPTDTVRWGYRFMVLAAAGNVLLSYALAPALAWSLMPLTMYAIGQSIAAPALKALLLDQLPTLTGTASALRGSAQLLLLAIVAGVIAPLASASIVDLALAMFGLFLVGGVCWWLFDTRATVLNIQRT